MNDLGKFKTVLKDKCPNCNTRLQIRTNSVQYIGTRFFSEDVIICPDCGYSINLIPEKRRLKRNEDTEYED